MVQAFVLTIVNTDFHSSLFFSSTQWVEHNTYMGKWFADQGAPCWSRGTSRRYKCLVLSTVPSTIFMLCHLLWNITVLTLWIVVWNSDILLKSASYRVSGKTIDTLILLISRLPKQLQKVLYIFDLPFNVDFQNVLNFIPRCILCQDIDQSVYNIHIKN